MKSIASIKLHLASFAGFKLYDLDYAASLSDEERTRYGLTSDHIYLIRK